MIKSWTSLKAWRKQTGLELSQKYMYIFLVCICLLYTTDRFAGGHPTTKMCIVVEENLLDIQVANLIAEALGLNELGT